MFGETSALTRRRTRRKPLVFPRTGGGLCGGCGLDFASLFS